jgi:hypothetical protein
MRETQERWRHEMLTGPPYPKEEIVRRGKELYEREIRSKVEAGNYGKVLAIDIETGDYEIDDDLLSAVRRLRARNPDAVPY